MRAASEHTESTFLAKDPKVDDCMANKAEACGRVWAKDTMLQALYNSNWMSRSQEPSLRDRQVQQMLKLEELFHSHYLTEELLNDLIALYVKFSEMAHALHPIRIYFMEKIRFVLSRPEVVRGLEKDRESGREPAREIDAKRHEEARHHPNGGKGRKVALGNTQENAKIELQMQVMKEVQQGMNAFREGINRETQWRQQKETQINQLVNEQDNALAQRRAHRKKKLRKKSANLTEELVVEAAPPIKLDELKQVHKEMTQTYERFTRLTQNKLKNEENKAANKGRVRFQIPEQAYEEEEFFNEPNQNTNHKHKQNEVAQLKQAPSPPQPAPRETTTVQYKTFDQNKGRVTMRNNQYEQIDEEQLLL